MDSVDKYVRDYGEWRDFSYFSTIGCMFCGSPIQTHDCIYKEDGFTGETATLYKEGTCLKCGRLVKWIEDIEIIGRRVRTI